MTSRDLVEATLAFRDPPRVPRTWHTLPCVDILYPDEIAALWRDYPSDIGGAPAVYRDPPPTLGDQYEIGKYVDEWGCPFTNIQYGVIGEVKTPPVSDWGDLSRIRFPTGWRTLNADVVNRHCERSSLYTVASWTPRPFEQLQFLRGTENLYCDLMEQEAPFLRFLADMHTLYCEVMEEWARTDVDMLVVQDDWGAQDRLLIPPRIWRALFLPMYRDYVAIAHAHGKRVYLHSDGNVLEILPDLVEIGFDALNLQVFCMGLDRLAPFAGQTTFWGELDRQRLLNTGTPGEVADAVAAFQHALWRHGGTIAMLSFGPSCRPELVRAGFAAWDSFQP